MATAYSCYGERIAPVFDVSRSLVITDDHGGEQHIDLTDETSLQEVIMVLRHHDVRTLICGAVSNECLREILHYEIDVIPFLAGNISKLRMDFQAGRSIEEIYAMPGCRTRNRCCYARRNRHAGI